MEEKLHSRSLKKNTDVLEGMSTRDDHKGTEPRKSGRGDTCPKSGAERDSSGTDWRVKTHEPFGVVVQKKGSDGGRKRGTRGRSCNKKRIDEH